MGSKRKYVGPKKNTKGLYLQEWKVLNSYGLAPSCSKRVKYSNDCPVDSNEGHASTSNSTPSAIHIGTNKECSANKCNSNAVEQEVQCGDESEAVVLEDEEQTHEKESFSDREGVITGRRIVDIEFMLDQLKSLNNHSPMFGCTFSDMVLVREKHLGLRSGFIFQCKMCKVSETVWSDPKTEGSMNINSCAVAGTITAGGGYGTFKKIMGALNIHCFDHKTFSEHERKVSQGWAEVATEEMKSAAEEEIALAKERGDVDQNGVPLLTVVADGSWSKRSYRTNYNALSGVAAIVGYFTRKVLYFGVKNKFCITCARSADKDSIPKHTCFKNWNGSSCSMEPAVIVEGFLRSEEMYGVKYVKLIADGDSSVYSKILVHRPYGTLRVEKIECRNHLLRNYCNKLKTIATTRWQNQRGKPEVNKSLHLRMRRVLSSRILRCRTAVTKAIAHRLKSKESMKKKAELIRKDLINGPSHVFGEHLRCAEIGYFCNGQAKENETNLVPLMKESQIYNQIMKEVNDLADYSHHLVYDVDSNMVEHFNSIVAVFSGGKRINFVQKNSYRTRCTAAVVSYNTRTPFYKLHKKISSSSPGMYAKLYEMSAKNKSEKKLERRKIKPRARRSLVLTAIENDIDYGPNAHKPDMDEDVFQMKVEDHMAQLHKTPEEVLALERNTANQSDNYEWFEERRLRLTASNFGLICNRKPHSSSAPVVNKLLYSNVDCAATRYGKTHEEDAVTHMEDILSIKITKCGLFVDKEHPWLAASPDGLIDDDGIVEVKCPLSGANLTPEQLIDEKKGTIGGFWQHTKNGKTEIRRRHNFFFQIQGQLHITDRKYCLFAVWTPLGMKYEKIEKDDDFWKNEMFPKLERFYFNCVLPELIDPRRRRNMPLREPKYIIDAQELVRVKMNRQKKE